MKNSLWCSEFWASIVFIILIFLGTVFKILPLFKIEGLEQEPDLMVSGDFSILQGNTLLPLSNPANPPPIVVGRLPAIVTAYSSSPQETDNDPYITAAGTWVREGIVANNYLPLGTRLKMPEIYGDKIFIVEDRMNWKKGNYHFDIWFPDYWQAKNFGAKRTYIEILEG